MSSTSHLPSSVRVSETRAANKERKDREAKGKSDHWVDSAGSAFKNPWPSWRDHDAQDKFYIIFQHSRRYPPVPENLPDLIPVRKPTWGLDEEGSKDKIRATWLGHACFLVELPSAPPNSGSSRGARILFDPVFSDRCSPSQWAGPKRITSRPCDIEEIPEVDAIVISHNHYDHLDTTTIRTLFKRERVPHIFAPLGNKEYFRSLGIPEYHTHILDWWDSRRVEIDFSTDANSSDKQVHKIIFDLTCTPAQHFTGRGVFDNYKSLWASWAVQQIIPSPSLSAAGDVPERVGAKVYFAGDTGYRAVLDGQDVNEVPKCPAFKQIGDRFGGFDFAMIPIGAYLPRRFMSPIHCSPDDSVLLFQDIRAKHALGMHWGTWILTTEDVMDPPKRLVEECEKAGIEKDLFTVCDIGETVVI
ncbi:N-acyl-phosphatidylethanolamine-hydrolyzing phospholipase D [Rickenella mellea]|uniref:N-acyl-phosphatidylethanolamine-hydrolyzing phospholipase D n=1 Tax=Rickenella mellea TaxID=50990 RepID=A0A4Y7PXN6_9AGAM|nr:N-acyl-phosphatidylethanolamine-hydrolyzing phospholipase D [Rickenella mellea]